MIRDPWRFWAFGHPVDDSICRHLGSRPADSTRWLNSRASRFFLLGPDRRLLFVNRAWEDLTGHSADSVVGLTCRPHGPTKPGDLEGLVGSFCPPIEAVEGRPTSSRTLLMLPDGERRWRRVEFSPFHDSQGILIGILGVVRPPDEPPQAPESEAQRLRVELAELRDKLLSRHGTDSPIGRGSEHRRLLDQLAAAASTRVPTLIVGESGTGRFTLARTIHQRSAHRQAPILAFDCQALAPEALERELAGIFVGTGARSRRIVDGTTLILREVLEVPRDLQARLASDLGVEVRLIATTSGDLDEARKADRIRPDFYHSLTTLVLRLRPLRDRLDELPVLAQHLLERANLRGDRQRDGFTTEAVEALSAYDWPGNLRELARVVEEAHATGDLPMIQVGDIPAEIRGERAGAYVPPGLTVVPPTLKEMLTEVERRLIEKALARSGDNKSKAAKLLGVNRPYLYRRLKELGMADEPEPIDDLSDLSS